MFRNRLSVQQEHVPRHQPEGDGHSIAGCKSGHIHIQGSIDGQLQVRIPVCGCERGPHNATFVVKVLSCCLIVVKTTVFCADITSLLADVTYVVEVALLVESRGFDLSADVWLSQAGAGPGPLETNKHNSNIGGVSATA